MATQISRIIGRKDGGLLCEMYHIVKSDDGNVIVEAIMLISMLD